MSGMDRHSEPQQHKTAAEYRQAADEHVRTLKDFWKDFLVSGLFVLAAIVAIFACLAWFVANNRVSAAGGSISAKDLAFTISAEGEGAADAHVGYYERDDRTEDEKKDIAGLNTDHSMTVTLNSNFNNNDAGGLYPGTRGVITFTVTPTSKNLSGVTIDISRILKTKDGGITKDEATQLLKLTKGHLLFFRNMNDGYYSNRITDSKIVLSPDDFCKKGSSETTESKTVNLYWVWPEYIQNLVLVKDANYYNNLFDEVGPDYNSLQAYVNGSEGAQSHKDEFYYGAAGGITAQDAPNHAKTMSSSDLATCSALYNNADDYIGTNVKYLQLTLSAREGMQ